MERSTKADWIAAGLFAATLTLSVLVVLVLPAGMRGGSALGMLAWVVLAGGATARIRRWDGGSHPYPWFLVVTSFHGWIALYFCSLVWGLMIVPSVGSQFTMLFPLTLPSALRSLKSEGEHPTTRQPRTLLLTISLIAVGHLLYFFSHVSPATRLFLIFLGVVSFLAAQRVRRAATSQAASGGACQGSA